MLVLWRKYNLDILQHHLPSDWIFRKWLISLLQEMVLSNFIHPWCIAQLVKVGLSAYFCGQFFALLVYAGLFSVVSLWSIRYFFSVFHNTQFENMRNWISLLEFLLCDKLSFLLLFNYCCLIELLEMSLRSNDAAKTAWIVHIGVCSVN